MIDWQGGIVLGVFCAGELLSLPVYRLLRRRFDSGPGRELADIEIWKGALERLVLVGGVLLQFPHGLTVFAALKLANHLSVEQDDDRAKI